MTEPPRTRAIHADGWLRRLVVGLFLPLVLLATQTASARVALPDPFKPAVSGSDQRPYVVNLRAGSVAVNGERLTPRPAPTNPDVAFGGTMSFRLAPAAIDAPAPSGIEPRPATRGSASPYHSRAPPPARPPHIHIPSRF